MLHYKDSKVILELNSLVYEFLVKQKCFETAALFLNDIDFQVDPVVINSDVALENVIERYKHECILQNAPELTINKRKISEVSIGNIDDSSSSEDYSDSSSDESDVIYIKTDFHGVNLPSVNEIFGADRTQREYVTNRKRIELELFREYKIHFGDLRVPNSFSVPYEASWSQKYHGAKLGKIVDVIRQSLKANKLDYCEEEMSELLEMGFVADAFKDKNERIVLAFQLFIAKYGHADVSEQFRIDKNDEIWPIEVRGLNLGRTLAHIRNQGLHKDIRQHLTDIGVDLTAQNKTLSTEQLYNTLVIYRQLHGNVDVKSSFVVPETADYPEYAWGCALGKCVYHVINKGSHSHYREQWEEMGLSMKHKLVRSTKDITIDDICEAIECYRAIHGHLNATSSYLVPTNSTFPSHLHGIRLGKIMYKMRTIGSYAQHKDRLAKMGVVVAKRVVYA